jgi:putative glycosyltransferase (TIGR04372 family)
MKWEEIRQACKKIQVLVWGYRLLRLIAGKLILLCVQVVRPLVKIRVGLLIDKRIGHLAANTEYWLRKEFPKKLPEERCIFMSSSKPANHQLVAMFGRVIPVIKSDILYALMADANRRWPQHSIWINLGSLGPHDEELWSNSMPQLAFTDNEIQRGQEILRSMGVPDGSPYVCFAMRDKAYLDSQLHNQSWGHHDYRDVDIENCRLMAEWLASCGIGVLRVGAVVEKSFGSSDPRIIDYADRFRSDFGDIFLLGNCKFFVGDTAGLFWVAAILGVPVVLTNQVPITALGITTPGSMAIPKKYRHSEAQAAIPYRKVVESGVDGYLDTGKYEQAQIALVQNTPEEILGLVQEVNARIDGTWVSTPEDEDLHTRFWSIFPAGHLSHGSQVRISADFLRRNRDLLA